MAKKTEQIDVDNFNAFRKTKNPNALPYVSQGAEKDNAAIQWAKKEGFDNSKSYIHPVVQQQLDKANGVIPAPTVPVPVAEPVLKPANLDQDTYDMLVGQGISQERINELYAPNEKAPFTRMFKEETPEPTPIDEKKLQASRNLANLGEGVKVLGDMFGVSRGAQIERRNAGELTARQQATEQTERDRYLAKLDQFNQGKKNAVEKDWMLALQDKERGLAQIQSDMKEKQAIAMASKKLEATQKELDRNYDLKKMAAENTEKHQKNQDAIGFERAQSAKDDKKADRDPNMTQVEIGGKVYNIPKAYKASVIGKIRRDFGGDRMEPEIDDKTKKPTGKMKVSKDVNDKPIPSEVSGMTDDEIFNVHGGKYLRADGKLIYISQKPMTDKTVIVNKGEKKQESKKNTTNDPLGIL